MCHPDSPYTNLLFSLEARDWEEISNIIKNGRLTELNNDGAFLRRNIKYGAYGDLDIFFRTHKPCIYFLKKLASILHATNHHDEVEVTLQNISIAENRILLLVAIYLGSIVTFTGVAGPVGYFLGATAAIAGTIYCKHANNPKDFLNNILISFDEKVLDNLKCDRCTSKVHVIAVQPKESSVTSSV